MVNLQDKVVIVTGGGSGVGRSLCLQFADKGARVVVADIDEKAKDETLKLMADRGYKGIAIRLNVTSQSSWQDLRSQVRKSLGDCDVLCNNAGVFRVGLLNEAPLEDWHIQSRVNIDGVILGCHTFIGDMISRGDGYIVNTSSMAGLYGCAGMSTYSASKFAVTGFTQALHDEVEEAGIRVAQLCPGAIDTPMNHDIDVPLEDRLIPPEEVAERVIRAVESGDNPPFIFTHPEFAGLMKAHYDAVVTDYTKQFGA